MEGCCLLGRHHILSLNLGGRCAETLCTITLFVSLYTVVFSFLLLRTFDCKALCGEAKPKKESDSGRRWWALPKICKIVYTVKDELDSDTNFLPTPDG